jgi:hypothetical protein
MATPEQTWGAWVREEPPELAGPTPSRARIFDHYLGGTDHFRVDCEVADEADRVFPAARQLCRDHRRFSRAVVRHLGEAGIDQFLELGSGLPTVDPVHTVAARHVPDRRVVYVDVEPETAEHAARLVAGEPGVAVECADATDVAAVLATPGVRELIDLDRPVAVLAVALLHLVGDEVARAMVHGYRDAVAPGSAIALSQPTDLARPDLAAWRHFPHTGLSSAPILRDPDDMAPWLAGTELVGRGWVSAPDWTPDGPAPGAEITGSGVWGVVARVP